MNAADHWIRQCVRLACVLPSSVEQMVEKIGRQLEEKGIKTFMTR